MGFITATALSVVVTVYGGVSQRVTTYESMPVCKAAMMEEVQLYEERETVRHIGNGVVFVARGVTVRMNCTSQHEQPKSASADIPQ